MFGLAHCAYGLLCVFHRSQLIEAEAVEQALGGQKLKRVILHQKNTKRVSGHRKHTVRQASMGAVELLGRLGTRDYSSDACTNSISPLCSHRRAIRFREQAVGCKRY